MNETASHLAHHAKLIASISVYALTTFIISALVVALTPDQYNMAILVAWIASIAITGRLIRSR